MVKESRFSYTNIVNTNIVKSKRVPKVLFPQLIAKPEVLEERRVELELKKQKQKEYNKKQKEKPKHPFVIRVMTAHRFSLADTAISDMEEDIGRKLTREEKKKIREDYKFRL